MGQRQIVVTGASRGFGRAAALALAIPETDLVLAARDGVALEAVSAAAVAAGASAQILTCDVTQPTDVQRLLARAGAHQRLDMVVHAAGATVRPPADGHERAHWEHGLHAWLAGTSLVCQEAARRLQPGAALVIIAPTIDAEPGSPANIAQIIHASVGALAATLAEALRPAGVRVELITPWPARPVHSDDIAIDDADRARVAEVARRVARVAELPPLSDGPHAPALTEQAQRALDAALQVSAHTHPARLAQAAALAQLYAGSLLRRAIAADHHEAVRSSGSSA